MNEKAPKGNRNRATLAVVRKLVAYIMAADKNKPLLNQGRNCQKQLGQTLTYAAWFSRWIFRIGVCANFRGMHHWVCLKTSGF
ncbi:MAG: hypothetical protein D3925_01735 [Candidatus Electrothrix sp. AR5]|nr:hypothetical protein [Candidatus Electrothrix sp. AR5]